MTTELTNLQLIDLSNNAYNANPDSKLIPDGYQRLDMPIDALGEDGKPIYGNEGFKGAAYYNQATNKLVVAYGGTDLGLAFFQDADDDSGFVTGATIDQAKYAQKFYENAINKVKEVGVTLTQDDITLTGHSLGGGLAAMVGILKDVVATVFNAPNVGRQIDNIEEMDDVYEDGVFVSEGSITKNQLTSKDLSSFKVTNIVLETDGVHYAGNEVGKVIKVDDNGSISGTVLYALSGVAGAALMANPIGAAVGLLGKFVLSGLSEKHILSALSEGVENKEKIDAGHAEETTTQKFLNAVGSINSYIDQGVSSVVDTVNKAIDWMSSGHVIQDLTGAAKDAWNSTVSLFDGLFGGHDGSAPVNVDGTVNTGLIDNSQLNLDIRTDLTSNFLGNNNITQTGNVIGDGDWEVSAPINNLNGDGYKNVAPYGIVSDQFRPGNSELSQYANFNTELRVDFSRLDNLMNNQSSQQLNFQLQNPLANLTNNFINARTFLNIDPVVLDLNGDGVKLTSYNESEVTFDVDNDGKQERTGWVSKQDGILVHDKNQDGKINNITETISEYYNPNDGSVADADGKYSKDGLAALKKLDSNGDGKFNNQDAKWNDLRVWVDANGDGVTDTGELKTLAEAGIKEINLNNIETATKERNEGNIILSKSTYTTTGGQTKQVAAVDFTTNPIGYEFNDVNLGKLATSEEGTKSLIISNENGGTVTASDETAQNIFGNIGNDTIMGDDRDNWLSGSKGSDTLKGGKGDDILIIDSEDKQENIDGGEGRDIVIINSDKGVSFNLTESHIETAVGGNGDDVLIGGGTSNVFIDGGSGDDIIIGGAADDALAGSDGNDYIDGGYGDDVIRGHRGQDILIGGAGNDYLEGGLDNDKIFSGAGNDIIMEGAGNDEIDAGEGYDLVKYQGSYKDFKITRDGANYKIQDLKTGNIDSVKNVEGVRFTDATLKLSADNISPLPVADLITLANKQDTVFIAKADLLKNDLDVEGDVLTIISVQNSVGGSARLVKSDIGEVIGVEFTPDKSFIGNMSFDYDVKDSKGAYTTIEQRNNDRTSVTAAMKARVTFKLDSDPNDALYSKQWYLSEINVQKAWEDYSGEGVKIGIFENGDFNSKHQDLDDNTLTSHKEDQVFRQVDQYSQHKTTVAGVIAAERNDYGIVGVAYNSDLDGYGWDADETGLKNLKNVDIANNSWGEKYSFSDNKLDPNSGYQEHLKEIKESVKEGRDGLGTINVFAGGNARQEGDNVNYHSLQNSRFVIATGSINQPGDLATLTQASTPFSNPGDAILVSAPGSNINSTGNLLTNDNGSQFLGEFSSSQGTSLSAPIISGIVALMLQANPDLGYRDVQKILALSARKFNDPNTSWQDNGAENWNGGAMHFSHDYGFGIVDAAAAVRLAETWKEQSTYYNENFFTAENSERISLVDNATVGKQFTISQSNMHNIETVEVEVNLSHLSLSDLTIKLVSPSGTESVLLDKPTNSVYEGGLAFNFSSRAFLGESVDGDWKLLITDSKTGEVGYLNSWKLKFYGELNDGKSDLYVYTDEFAKLTDGSRGIINDTDGGVDTINAAAVSTDTTINLNAGQISKIAGHDVLISGGTKGEEYYQKQALLPTKEEALATKNSELLSKNQTLSIKNTEFAGIAAAINAKASEYNQKQSEYQTALTTFDNIKWWADYSYVYTIDGVDIYQSKINGSIKELSRSQSTSYNNSYNSAAGAVNQKVSEVNAIAKQHDDLVARHDALPSEIGSLQNEIVAISGQVTQLQSEVNFIKTYLNSFDENGASVIENAYTGDGNDKIIGSDLANEIWGGRGKNTLTGNGGADTFIIKKNAATVDTITDFKPGEDKIDLTDFGNANGNITLADLSITQNGANVEIKFSSGQKIILENINAGQILTDSFTGITEIKNPINGTFADDVLVGTSGGDLIKDSFGNDVIKSLGGNDEIDAGMGNDRIFGGAGDDVIYGGRGNDVIYADGDLDSNGAVTNNDTRAGKNKIFGGDNDDTIFGGSGNDYIDGGEGNDTLSGGAGNDTIIVGAGNNQVQAGSGNDGIDLSGGNFAIGDRVNFVSGGDGSDKFILDNNDTSFWNEFNVISDFDVNDPNEKIDLSKLKTINKFSDLKISQQGSDTQIIVNTNFFGRSQIIKLENVDASKLNSSKFIISNEAPEVGNDSISTLEDKSIIINILANDSDDKTDITKTKITVTQPANGTVTLNSDGTVTYKPKDNFNGVDQFEYQLTDAGGLNSSSAKVTVNINSVNDAPIVTKIVDDKTFYSTKGINFTVNDVFNDVDGDVLNYAATLADGSPLPNWITFNSETMTFSGMSPNGGGVFTIKLTATDESNASTSTNIKLTINGNIIVGTDGDDNLNGNTIDNVIDGGLGNDIIVGGTGSEVIFGGAGNDELSSGSGNDKLYGEAGDDILRGNSGNQILDGGDGNDKLYSAGSGSNDTLTGGSGSDIFVIGNDIISNDVITDFNVADPNEKIDLSLFKDVATDISQLVMEQVGSDTKISFSSKSKTILIKNVSMDQLTAAKFIGLTDNKNSGGSVVINGTTGNDTLTGGTGNDIIKGDKGNDIIKGGLGSNLLTGGAGDDTFVISKNPGKTDIVADFEAFDSLSFDGFVAGTKLSNFSYTEEGNSVTFNLGDGQNLTFQNAKAADILRYLSFTSVSTSGTAGNDKIISSGAINGGDGDDIISAGSGNDTINGGKGNDILRGGDWFDIFEINKNPGDKDTILDFKMSDMVDSIVLKGFSDTKLSNYPATQSGNDVIIDLGEGQTLTLKNFKLSDVPYIPSYSNRITNLTSSTVSDTDGNDIITTDSWYPGGATITTVSGKGNDVLTGAGFAKDLFVINKNPGDVDFVRYVDTWRNDKVVLKGFSNDILDKIKFLPSSDPYTLIMDLGDGQILRTYGVQQSEFRSYFDVEKTINPTDGNDILSAGYFSNSVDGGAGNDVITGNNLGNTLSGGDGNDTITAGNGNDTINGGNGNDKITTGAGNDLVNAGSGNDEINISANGTKTISGGEGSDIYKISSFTGDITISDFDISNPNEVINLQNITNILSLSNLLITQQGLDSVVQISASQKIIFKNIDKNLLTADKFVFYSNQFLGSPIADNISGSVGDDFINTYGGNDSVYLSNSGSDTIDLGAGNDSFTVGGNGFYGNDNVTGGAGNDKFSIDLGYSSYDTTNHVVTINDFEVSNPNEKIYINNSSSSNVNMDFTKDLKIDQIGNDVQIKLVNGSSNKSIILKNVNKADLNEKNIVLPKEQYKAGTTESDDSITYDPNAGLKNLLGQDRGISVNGTMTNVSMVISGNQTTITLKAFDPSKDRIKVDPSYGITKYSDMPLVQEGSNVAMSFVNESVPLSSSGSSFGATRYTKVVLENVNLADLKEDDFVFYNHSTAGNDTINGLGGNDYIEGGEGNDTVNGGNGNDELLGGNGNDTIAGDAGDDEIYGGDGNDSLSDSSGNNKLYGGAGNDMLGNNSLSNNEFYGEEGDDMIYFNSGNNIARGGVGNDKFIVYGGDNEIYGEEGIDTYIIRKSSSFTFNGSEVISTDTASATTIHDFDPSSETINLEWFDYENLDQVNIVQDGNDVVLNLSALQTVRIKNISKADLNQDNIIIPAPDDEHIQRGGFYSFDDRTGEYSIEDINKTISETQQNSSSYYPSNYVPEPVATIASEYDPVLMKTVSTFDVSSNKINLGKIKTLEKFEDLKITQHSIAQSYGSPSEFTLIDLGDGSFVKLDGFYTLTADNFTFNKAPTANLSSANINEDGQIALDVVFNAVDNDDDVLSITEITSPSHGSATIVTDEQGRQKISYIPTPNFNGIDQFNYTISDGRGGVVTKTLTVTVKSVNDNPTTTIAEASVNENNSVIIDVLAGASDADGDQLSIVGVYGVTTGVANVVDGKIVYTPNANYSGLTNFDYTISDGNGGFVTKTLNIDVKGVNDAPTIKSVISSSVVDEDAVNTVLNAAVVSDAFSDIDGDVLTYEALLSNGNPLPSWLTINSVTGEITSTNPSNNQVGNHGIIITATDSSGASVSQNFVITVNNINDAPTASLVTSSGNEDSGQITLAFNGSDVDASDVLNYSILSNPSFGSIVNNNNGTFTFNLGNDFQNLGAGQTTDVSFTYLATDSSGVQSNVVTATITITGTNDAPTASITSIATNEDNSVKIDVLAYASDADAGDALSLTSVTHGSHGTASIATDTNGNKVISYVPSANYNGSDVITYTISDNNGATVTKELTVTVNAINDAPIIVSDAQNQAAESGKAFTYALPSNLFSDIDGDSLTINATLADGSALPSWLSFDGSKFSGTPNVSSATNLSIKLTATDSSGASVSQNFGINVTNPNNAPIAKDDAFALNEDASLTISFASILKNDSDVEDKTNIQKLTKDNIIFNNPGNGTITVTDTGIIYKPNKDFNGSDSLTYQIKDSSGALSNSATINLTVKPVNDAPVVASDSFVTDEDTSIIIKLSDLLVNDFDAEDGAAIQNLTLDKFVFSNPGKGTIVKDAVNNTIIYTPNKNYNGTDFLTYQIKDSNGALSNKVKINLSINAVNDGPIATNDSFTTNEDRVITINFSSILRNDSDVEDGVNIKQITKDNIVFGDPVNGKITITDTGIIYAPNKDFNGSDSLTYQIKDSNGTLSNIANINLTIKAINDAPVAASDSFVTSEDSSLIIKLSDLLANDFDVEDGQAIQDLTLDRMVFSNPTKGKIVKDVINNTIIYTPNKDYNGSDSLTYQIKDSNGTLSNKATISLTVEAVNDAPVAGTKLADKSVKAGNLFSYTLPVKAFTDVDKDALTYSAKLADDSELPSWLKFDNATKTFSGTSPSGTASTLLIKVTANDGSLDASQSFSLKITSNLINGTSGNNTLNGTSLNDEIYGNDGIDNIKGNAGNDLIIGGKGADVLLGGAGNDQFIFSNLTDSTINESDLILDFIKGEDKVNLSGLGFEDITNQSGSTHSAHGLEYYFDGKNTVIDDPNSNFAVKLAGDISLDHNDFAF